MLLKVIETFFIEIAIPTVTSLFLSDGKLTGNEKETLDKLESFFWVWVRVRASIILFFIASVLILFAIEYGKIFA